MRRPLEGSSFLSCVERGRGSICGGGSESPDDDDEGADADDI